MQIVISMFKADYEWIKEHGFVPEEYVSDVGEAIVNGILLPQGHGDLIDRDALAIAPIDTSDLPIDKCLMVYLAEDVVDAPIIIEADKEGNM